MSQETPNTVHGRLLESVHLSGYTAERARSELKWLLEDGRWRTVGPGFDDIDAFLATLDLSGFRHSIETRQELVKLLDAERATQRATARVFRVGVATVNRDLVPNGTRGTEKTAKPNGSASSSVPNGTVPWFQRDADPSKLAKTRERQEKKREERLALTAVLTERNAALPLGGRKYSAIYADPPWRFEVWSEAGKGNSVESHYPTMAQAEIEALPVSDLATDDCALFLWAVMPQLPEALAVIEAWGFTFKTVAFTWVKTTKDGSKPTSGMGYWTLANAELCLLATRGSPTRLNGDVPQVILEPRREHSRKPDTAAERIERLVAGPYIELFSRQPRTGWEAWGNQA